MKKRHLGFLILVTVWESFIPVFTFVNIPNYLGSLGFFDMVTKWTFDLIYPAAAYYGFFLIRDRWKKKQANKTPI